MQQKINVGLIGFGLSGRYFHAPFLTTNANFGLTKVVERHRNEAEAFDASIRTVRSHEDLLTDPAIDLIIVSTPNDTHFPYAKAALEAGKHVLIEKPFANTSEEARQLLQLAKDKNLVAIPYQNRRYDADFLTIRQLLAEDALGEVVEYESHFDRFRPDVLQNWKEQDPNGGGNLLNLGPHLVDQAVALFGAPEAVLGDIRTVRKGGTLDDYFDIRLFYSDKRVILKSSLTVPENRLRYIIHGTKASLTKSGLDIQEETLRKNMLPNTPDWGVEPEDHYATLTTADERHIIPSLPGNYHPFYDNLARAIRGEIAPEITPEQAYATIRILELAGESSRERRAIEF
ncbi:oxidoreductase [Tellurirhabdus rosea]|uniref:oxidoreductase n=1 Tax=Tellurirhabdus rosea TaxID=2674997 RepID=UPI00225A4CB9|nr:oxidoreductase [Tellurirhabdus rosea]